MIIEVLKRSIIGIAFGAISTFIALTIMKFNNIEGTISEVWLHMLASFILGIYYGLSSFIFENNRWSPLKKTIIHFSLSIVVYFLIAFPVGWVPLHPLAIVLSIFIFIVIYVLFWSGYYLYYKKVEASMNAQLKKKE